MPTVIIGNNGGTNIAQSFLNAANNSNLTLNLIEASLAYQSYKPIKMLYWYLLGKYPPQLKKFGIEVFQECLDTKVNIVVTTGLSPINQLALSKMGEAGIKKLNFLTDDPWNPAHYAPWFLKALPHYDIVFSPRRAAIDDLIKLGCPRVEYLPFGYDPDLFYPESTDELEPDHPQSDIMFAGGADRDRVPYISTLIQAGFKVDLYGSYWERYPGTKPYTKGQADVPTLRRAIQTAKIALCIVRHANRDGHCMRTFEVPAIGTCMLTEDTLEHREIFGAEGEAVVYFKTLSEMVEKTHWLLEHDGERQRLARNAHLLITQGGHSYRDRLQTMLSIADTL